MAEKYISRIKNILYLLKATNLKKFLDLVIDAVKGNEHDYTQLKLSKAILLLSIPMVLEMMMESVFAIVDILFVSKLGADAIAAVGLTESLMTVVYSAAMGFSIAASAVVSRRVGEKDFVAAGKAAYQSIITSIAVSLLFAIPGIFFAKEILAIMGASHSLIEHHSGYLQIILSTNFIVMLLFVINAVFRGAGDAALSLRVLFISNLLNIALDPVFIFGWGPVPAMGVEGAAIATCTGRGIAVIYQLYVLISGKNRVKISFKSLKPDFTIIKNLVKLSSGVISQHLIATASWILMMRFVSEFGSAAVAGYTITLRIMFFALMPSFGMSNAAATLVGQNLGAGKPERAEKSVYIAAATNTFFLLFICLAFTIFPDFWIKIFTNDPKVTAYGAYCLFVLSLGFVFYGSGMVLLNALNGAGDTVTPMKLNVFVFWIVEIPLAYLLAFVFDIGAAGVYWAVVIAETIFTVAAGAIFWRGKWKHYTV